MAIDIYYERLRLDAERSEVAMKPKKMKTVKTVVKGWAVVRKDGVSLWNGGQLPIYGTKTAATEVQKLFNEPNAWYFPLKIVRCEVVVLSELPPKRKAKR